jgi:hypothetical protein
MGQVIANERTFRLDFRDFRPGFGRYLAISQAEPKDALG